MPSINPVQAQSSLKKLVTDSNSLTPSALVQMFEIDMNSILTEKGLLATDFRQARTSGYIDETDAGIFRFHNNIKLLKTSIYFDSDKIQKASSSHLLSDLHEFIAAPINAQGFEVNARGTQPTPTLSLTTSDEGLVALGVLKDIIRAIGGDLAGAKVTRIRTLAKYLHSGNTPELYPSDTTNTGLNTNPDYDPYVEFPRDVFYIDRKSNEDKNTIEFELASLLDVEGIDLPLRKVIANRCLWIYRGEGCRYGRDGISSGIPVADLKDEKFSGVNGLLPDVKLVNKGKWVSGQIYQRGDYVFIERTIGTDKIPFYFVCKFNNTTSNPVNSDEWYRDECSKSVAGCRCRFKNVGQGLLPFGGFPAVSRLAGNY